MPLSEMPPGTVVNNVEKNAGDKGKFAKTSGGFAQIIGHIEGAGKTRMRMPSGQKKTISSSARAVVGIVAGPVLAVRHQTVRITNSSPDCEPT